MKKIRSYKLVLDDDFCYELTLEESSSGEFEVYETREDKDQLLSTSILELAESEFDRKLVELSRIIITSQREIDSWKRSTCKTSLPSQQKPHAAGSQP